MPELSETQSRLKAAREQRDETRQALRRDILTVRELEERLARARRAGPDDQEARARITELERELDIVSSRVDRRKADLTVRRRAERDLAADVLVEPPQSLIEQLDDATPFLLLPVHIETRFLDGPRGRELGIRIYPDDIAIATHEATLTEREAEDGRTYWRARAAAGGEPSAQDRTNAVRGAWNVLASRHGAHRAAWIARVTRPTNWQDDANDPAALIFPVVQTKSLDSTETPRSGVLPDRFVVVLFSATGSREVAGRLIPDDLALGPDPIGAEGLLQRDPATGRLVLEDDLRWMVDFDLAVQLGMALRIALQPEEANGLERIVVLGLRTSSSAADGATRLARLVEAHRYGTGFALVPQGTPTNNTDAAKSGFTTSSEEEADALWVEQDGIVLTPETDHLRKTDGQRIAEALALPLDAIAPLPNATRSDIAEAIAMNRALWGATLGGFLNELMKPLVDDADIARTQRFFTAFVLGRGLLPAVRAADQPYGVLITSSFARWKFTQPELGEDAAFWNDLAGKLRRVETRWKQLVPQIPFAGKPGDPFVHLLGILGLQASSVEFHSRKAIYDQYLWNYLSFQSAIRTFATRWWNELRNAKVANLARLGLNLPLAGWRFPELTFMDRSDRLTGPVIDGDPRVPLSETQPIRPFDGTRNYIDWLLTGPRADLEAEVFRDSEGKAVSPPAALLYRLLRHAYLAELGRGGRSFVKDRAAAVFAELPAEPPIANVGATQTLSTSDVLAVDTSRIGVTRRPMAVADYLIDHVRTQADAAAVPPQAATLADKTLALQLLARLPTARLERCFAEHMDVCGYRLDAWIQGLFARRLALLRDSARTRKQQGIYLGAYGWVENVTPSKAVRRSVPRGTLPEPLRAGLSADPVEYEGGGGFVHAPSVTHAVTAAILRNAYLTHADAQHADTMAVNLSSSRVRTALAYMEGLRNGQELAALLGYQLERGMHENHPGIELDEFIYTLRDRFPFVSKKLTPAPDGTAAELLEARNVINGYDLLQFIRGKTYPYGIAGLPTDTVRAGALRAEIDRLADTMDALGDLVLAESVHQVVQGNYDRARGILQTATEGSVPPDIEVVVTPRSGRSLTHRVALHLDPAAVTGWTAALTPRARADRPLNHWLAGELPPPQDVQWSVTLAGVTSFVGLDTLGLEPIDVVLLSGDRIGDQSSELERFLVYDRRRKQGVADDVRTFFAPDIDPAVPADKALVIDAAAAQPGRHSLASLLPLLSSLRRLLAQGRPLNAQDHALPAEAAQLDAANPRGWDDGAPPLRDVQELKARIEATHTALDSIVTTQLAPFLSATVQPLHDALKADPDRVIVPAWAAHLATIRTRLEAIFAFGIVEALPAGGLATTEANIDALVLQAGTVVKLVNARLAEARARLDIAFTEPLPVDPGEAARERAFRADQRVASYTEAARALLGRAFTPLPLFRFDAIQRSELAAALASPVATDPLATDTWFQSLVRVRDAMGNLGWLLQYHEWLHGTPRALQPIQLPVRAGDRWIGEEFGADLGPGDVLSMALLDPPGDVTTVQCGWLIDEWTELVPTSSETTGLAVHTNRPNAVAPQALLLAIAPELRGTWRWQDLLAVVTETLERARLRAIEPDMISATEYFQLLPATMMEFSTGSPVVSTVLAHNVVARTAGP